MIKHDHILVVGALPDEKGIYAYRLFYGYQEIAYYDWDNHKPIQYPMLDSPIYSRGEPLETNTIRILELENVLAQYKDLELSSFISFFKKEKIQYGRELILKEIEYLKKNSVIIWDRIPEYEKQPAKIAIPTGYDEAKQRFSAAVRGKNYQYEHNYEAETDLKNVKTKRRTK